jgi:hypothetical protein
MFKPPDQASTPTGRRTPALSATALPPPPRSAATTLPRPPSRRGRPSPSWARASSATARWCWRTATRAWCWRCSTGRWRRWAGRCAKGLPGAAWRPLPGLARAGPRCSTAAAPRELRRSLPPLEARPASHPLWQLRTPCSPHAHPAPAPQGSHFSVIVTEGRPDNTGLTMAKALTDMGVPVTLVLDSGVAYAMERCDMVLVRADCPAAGCSAAPLCRVFGGGGGWRWDGREGGAEVVPVCAQACAGGALPAR